MTIDVRGTGGTASDAYSFISPSFQKAPSASGSISSVSSNTITASSPGWTIDEFANSHFIEITSGANTGLTATIGSNTENSLTTVEDLSSFLAGDESFAIREYLTIGDLFGEDNSAGLQSAASIGGADEILLPDGNGDFDRYFYLENPLLGSGWRSSEDLNTNAGSTPVPIGQGLIVRRKASDDLEVVLSGSVVSNESAVYPIETGFNFIASAYPVSHTLNSFFGSNGGSLQSGSSLGDADQVLVQRNDGSFDYFFYLDNPLLGSGWRDAEDLQTDAGETIIIAPGSSVIVDRAGDPFNFAENKPF